ncbi:transcriptional activator hap3 [Thecaphora frezii]
MLIIPEKATTGAVGAVGGSLPIDAAAATLETHDYAVQPARGSEAGAPSSSSPDASTFCSNAANVSGATSSAPHQAAAPAALAGRGGSSIAAASHGPSTSTPPPSNTPTPCSSTQPVASTNATTSSPSSYSHINPLTHPLYTSLFPPADLPIANISRIMKRSLPENAKIAKDAKECVQDCVSELISFVTSEASDKCAAEKRKTINGDDILYALRVLGFDNYEEVLKVYLSRYRMAQEINPRSRKRHSKPSALATGADLEDEDEPDTEADHSTTTILHQPLAADTDPHSQLQPPS